MFPGVSIIWRSTFSMKRARSRRILALGRWGGYDAGATKAYSLGADVGESDRRTAESASRSAMTGTTT
jgi:hypothetical protein